MGTRICRTLLLPVLIMLAAGCGSASLRPSLSVTTTVPGWEHYFRLEWTAQATPQGTLLDGYIHNTYGSSAGSVQVLAQALDGENIVAQRIEWVPGGVPGFGRSYFRVAGLPAAREYRVSVWAFTIIDTDSPFRRRPF